MLKLLSEMQRAYLKKEKAWKISKVIDLSTTKDKRVIELNPERNSRYGIYDNGSIVQFIGSLPKKFAYKKIKRSKH